MCKKKQGSIALLAGEVRVKKSLGPRLRCGLAWLDILMLCPYCNTNYYTKLVDAKILSVVLMVDG